MLEVLLKILIGPDGEYFERIGGFLSGIADNTAAQAALIDVLSGGNEVYQEWDGEQWVNVDRTHDQPIFPWDPTSNPGRQGDPIADLLGQLFPPA